jgi:hypothetical protein
VAGFCKRDYDFSGFIKKGVGWTFEKYQLSKEDHAP